MTPGQHILCEFALGFGAPLLLAARELWALRRGGGSWRPDDAGIPPPPKPLPDCLIPRLPPHDAPEWREERELETA